VKFVAASVQFHLVSCRTGNTLSGQIANANYQDCFWWDRCNVSERWRFFTMKMGSRFFTSHWQYDLPGWSAALQSCFSLFFCGWITWTAREGAKHPSRSICRRHDSLGVATMCGFASALTHCGFTPAIPLRSLPGYLRNIRFFSLRSRTLCGATWQIFRPLRAAECSGFKPQPLFFCTCTPE